LDADATAPGDAEVVAHPVWRVVEATTRARNKEAAAQLIR